jgi:quercetin dioxygenase-like cupin family protein
VSYTHLAPGDPAIESFRDSFFKIRKALGTTAFGLNEVRMPPGFEGPAHDESDTGHEEVYVCLEGGATVTIGDEEVQLEPGAYLRVAPGTQRQVQAGPAGVRFLAIGGKPRPEYDGRPTL